MKDEAELIREAISRYTEAEYEFSGPISDFPAPEKEIVWLLVSPFPLGKGSHSPAPTIWEDKRGILHVQSIQLGDTSRWLEEEYGEKGVIQAGKTELDLTKDEGRRLFKKLFPRVYQRLSDYERIPPNISSRRGIELNLSFARNGHITTFYATAAISAGSLDTQAKIEKIKLSIEAIKEALDRIEKLDAEWAKRTYSGRTPDPRTT